MAMRSSIARIQSARLRISVMHPRRLQDITTMVDRTIRRGGYCREDEGNQSAEATTLTQKGEGVLTLTYARMYGLVG